MTINIQENTKFKAFINVKDTKDTSVEQHNELVEQFIAQFNEGALTVDAFKGKDGKWVLGFR